MSKRKNAALIAIGSNIGNRVYAIHKAINRLNQIGELQCTGNLYESIPMYFKSQNNFLNTICSLETNLSPMDFLHELQQIEKDLGRNRNESFQNGPRPIDLDIIFYNNDVIHVADLQVPHPRLHERPFVLRPLCDFEPDRIHPNITKSMTDLYASLSTTSKLELTKVIPIGNTLNFQNLQADSEPPLIPLGQKPLIMGILNITPDSFSDGGMYNKSIRFALDHVKQLAADGADIIDIGGESTRPGATPVSKEEELSRVIPIIRAIRSEGLNCTLSVDTRSAVVASESVMNGANMINDVSGGDHDPNMITTVAQLNVPYVVMHMRGNPQTMMSPEHVNYNATDLLGDRSSNVVDVIANELKAKLDRIDKHIPRWLQIVDPGIGFSKQYSQNLSILTPNHLKELKSKLMDRPLMIGLSRKKFISNIIQQDHHHHLSRSVDISMEEKDLATAGASCASILGGADILRVHNVKFTKMVCSTFHRIINHHDESM